MKNILILNTIGMKFEGISNVIMNYMKYIDKKGCNLDFIITKSTPEFIIDTLKEYGNVIQITGKKENFRKYIKELKIILKNNKYDIIHIHGNSGMMYFETKIAKKNKIEKIIVHCHSTLCDHPIINKMLTPLMKKNATDLIACSNGAGNWLYGNSNYTILNNAIDIDKYKFDKKMRSKIRKELKIEDDTILIGHIGHFTKTKNHDFLVDVFKQYHIINSNSKLLLISDGPNYKNIQEKVKKNNLNEAVIFLGRRSDAYVFYQAMDIFLLPSLWEGLPLVMIEAQSSGLPCLVSDNITKDAKCCNDVFYKKLDDGPKSWAYEINSIMNQNYKRHAILLNEITQNGFNIKTEAKKLRNIYFK